MTIQTLSHGYKKPQTTDQGPAVFPALEANIDLVNSHNHDGTGTGGGAKLVGSSVLPVSVAVSGGWNQIGTTGHYEQTVTLPVAFVFDTTTIVIRLADGTQIFPQVSKVDANNFKINYDNPGVDLTILYN